MESQRSEEREVYLDYNASTPVDPRVLESMLPYFQSAFANPSSSHAQGRIAAAAVERARLAIAERVGASPRRLFMTSGATEANNLALAALVSARPDAARILVSATEHKSVLDAAWAIQGIEVVITPVNVDGRVDLHALDEILKVPTAGVSVMFANNETGVMNPIFEVVEVAHRRGALVHSDVTQALGKTKFDLNELGVDLASLSAHKAYGPKGVGCLFASPAVPPAPMIVGGGQERGWRAGTVNVPAVVGFGAAADLAEPEPDRVGKLADRLWRTLCEKASPVELNGQAAPRLANTLNVRFPGAEAEAILAHAPGVAMATGSACTSSVPAPSHVLLAMGLTAAAAQESLRLSIGSPTTTAEIDLAAARICDAVSQVRRLSIPLHAQTNPVQLVSK